ncbi:MAG TPA: DUF2934 domain-containing protein [Azospirillaceae bacterium]|nr:DUF2934 domain-containing protein [Azospirillaceae bacterium]
MDDRDEKIRQRAYEIWQREGCPEGRQEEHWQEACREIEAEGAGNGPAMDEASGGVEPGEAGTGAAAAGGRRGRSGGAAASGTSAAGGRQGSSRTAPSRAPKDTAAMPMAGATGQSAGDAGPAQEAGDAGIVRRGRGRRGNG